MATQLAAPMTLDDLMAQAYQVHDAALNGFDIFDKTGNRQSLDLSADMKALVAQGPVLFGKGPKFGNVDFPGIFDIEGRDTALVLDYDGMMQVYRDWNVFEQDFYPEAAGATLIHLNGEPHRRYRLLLMPVFSAKAIRTWQDIAVPPVLDQMFATLEGADRLDFLPFVQGYPARVFRSLLGLPEEDIDRVRALGVMTIAATMMPDGDDFVQELLQYLGGHVTQRRTLSDQELAQRTDIISLLVNSREGDDRLSDEEILATLYILVQAGVDTTALLAGNSMFLLLTRPDLMAQVRADRGLIPAFIEETLRMVTAGSTLEVRKALADVEISGTLVPAGTPVLLCSATANRDPHYWDDPDTFKLDRPKTQHFSFGYGPHMCVGMHLARMEVRCFLNEVLDRFPAIRLDPDAPPPEIKGVMNLHPSALPVVLR